MNKKDLINLSIAQIGLVLAYNVLTMNLQDYFQYSAFGGSANPNSWLLAFSVITIAFAAGAFTYLFAGWLSDKTYHKWGRRPYLLTAIPGAIALMFLGFNFIALEVVTSFIIITSLATTFAVTYRLMYTSYFALYQDLTEPEDRAKTTIIFSIFGLFGVAGAIIMPLAPKTPGANYLVVTILCGGLYIGTILYSYFMGPKENLDRIQKEERPGVLRSIRETFKDKDFKNYALSSFFAGFTYSAVMFMLKPFLDWKTNSINGRPVIIEIPFMLIIVSLLPIALFIFWFCGYASKKWGKRRFFGWALLIGAVTFPFMILFTNQGSASSLIIQLYILIIIVLFVVVVILSLMNALLMDVTPTGKEATYSGVFFFITVAPFPFASQLLGVLLSSFNHDIAGFWYGNNNGSDFAYGLMIVIMGFSLLVSWLFLRRVKYQEVMER